VATFLDERDVEPCSSVTIGKKPPKIQETPPRFFNSMRDTQQDAEFYESHHS
jgi:hypothetical protein